MAITRETTAANVRPLQGAIVRRFTASAAITAGSAVYMSGNNTVAHAAGGAVGTNKVIGIAINAAAASGDPVDVVVLGPVNCGTSGTAGAAAQLNDTAGAYDETGGTKKCVIGLVLNATTIFVRPQIVDFS
jgi:hypothetical protein